MSKAQEQSQLVVDQEKLMSICAAARLAWEKESDFNKAMGFCRQALAIDSSYQPLQYLIMYLQSAFRLWVGHYHDAGRFAVRVAGLANSAAEKNESAALLALSTGYNQLEAGEFQQAIDNSYQALSYSSNWTAAQFGVHYMTAREHCEQERYDQAIVACQEAMKISPRSRRILALLAVVTARKELALGNNVAALLACNSAIRLKPSYLTPYRLLAEVGLARRHYHDAISACRRAVGLIEQQKREKQFKKQLNQVQILLDKEDLPAATVLVGKVIQFFKEQYQLYAVLIAAHSFLTDSSRQGMITGLLGSLQLAYFGRRLVKAYGMRATLYRAVGRESDAEIVEREAGGIFKIANREPAGATKCPKR